MRSLLPQPCLLLLLKRFHNFLYFVLFFLFLWASLQRKEKKGGGFKKVTVKGVVIGSLMSF